MAAPGESLAIAAAAVAVLVCFWVFFAAAARGGKTGGGFDTGGPYNLGLYDSPRYYPYFATDAWTLWDPAGRCGAACRDDGCTLSCR